MFWSLNYGGSSIDSILERSSFTLEELLDEDELLQECKTQNTKLIDFLTQPESMARMISYIVEMPTEADTSQRRYKFPFISSEVLSCDVAAVRDTMLTPGNSAIPSLLALLDQPPPVPPVLAGYLSKVLVALYKGHTELFQHYFTQLWESEPDAPLGMRQLLPSLLGHLGSDAVLCLLVAMCAGEAGGGDPNAMVAGALAAPPASWLPHEELMPALLDNLANADAEAAANSAVLLCSLLDSSSGLPACLCEPGGAGRQRCATLVENCLGNSGAGFSASLNLGALDVLLRLLSRTRELTAHDLPASMEGLWEALLDSAEFFFVALAAAPDPPARIARFLPKASHRIA